MFSSEEGPLAIFAKMRRKVPPKTNPGRGIRCFNCWGIWVAMGITIFLWIQFGGPWIEAPLFAIGLSGVAIALNRALPSES